MSNIIIILHVYTIITTCKTNYNIIEKQLRQ